jgi:hypothetical protein
MLAEPLDDDDLERKEEYIKQGFPDWSRRDFQQLIRGLESYGWCGMNYIHIHLDRAQILFAGMQLRNSLPSKFKIKTRTKLLHTSKCSLRSARLCQVRNAIIKVQSS